MNRIPPTIDMLPDGTFRTAAPRSRVPLSVKLGLGAAAVAILGLSLTVAALAVYVVSMILPVIVIAGGVAWIAFKVRAWQRRGGVPSAFRS